MNSFVRLLCDSLEQICDRMEAGEVGRPGDVLYDELDACVTLLAYVRDRIDDPAAYLTLATKNRELAFDFSLMHSALIGLAEAKKLIDEKIYEPEQLVERADSRGVEMATLPAGETTLAVFGLSSDPRPDPSCDPCGRW